MDLDFENKQNFIKWLEEHDIKMSVSAYIEKFEELSLYAQTHGVCSNSFWEIDDLKKFMFVKKKLLSDRFFIKTHKSLFSFLERFSTYYFDFLQEKNFEDTGIEDTGIEDTDIETDIIGTEGPNSDVSRQASGNEELFDLTQILLDIGLKFKEVLGFSIENKENIRHDYSDKLIKSDDSAVLSFQTWLEMTIKLNDNISRLFITALSALGRYVVERGHWSDAIYGVTDCSEIDYIKEKLDNDYNFKDINSKSCNLYTCVLSQYISFLRLHDYKSFKDIPFDIPNSYNGDEYKDITVFWKWLSRKFFKDKACSPLYYALALKQVGIYVVENGYASADIFNISDISMLNTIEDSLVYSSEYHAMNFDNGDIFECSLAFYAVYIQCKDVDALLSVPDSPNPFGGILSEIILDEFRGIFLLNSSIYIEKLREYATQKNIDLSKYTDLGISALISKLGIVDDGKLYIFRGGIIEECVSKVNGIFSEGYSMVYISKLYDDNSNWFSSRNINTCGVLYRIISDNIGNIHSGKEGRYILYGEKMNERDAISNELVNRWGGSVIRRYEELYALLPYIPEDKIKLVLATSHDFVRSSVGVYARADMVIITEEEGYAIYDYVTDMCDKEGYALIKNVPLLGDIEMENFAVSRSAIYDVIYYRILSCDFERDNGVLCRRGGTGVDLEYLLDLYCSGRDEVAYSELDAYTVSLKGKSYAQLTYHVLYKNLIRVDMDKFIADKHVDFNVKEIDNVLDKVIADEFISPKSILSFIQFPDCGMPWNHYVLESYCRRFSEKFRFEFIEYNSKGIGIIAKKMCLLDYYKMCANVVAKSGINLNSQDVGRFLVENGYMAKSKFADMNKILQMAEDIKREL